MPEYDVAAINECRAALEGVKGKFGQSGDGLSAPDAAMFGQLSASGTIAAAVEKVCSTVSEELGKAEQKAGEAARALDATARSAQDDDDANAELLKPDTQFV
ncbi:hypothetical protein EV191_103208 [Tamaricihabitans halophyticus]|uniref:Excreted virulence factor EspC (Type VII ESX diderm) n=1 Tax=Tamaricihabitans halophyticus TaxID=1262583 RepID=A0A4R2QWS9_9PSEU|nr:hypothetical protein [Tamaricihabitans halophyticus]TCP54167.1 hypothetical protein EV191_103208 [Tamaricihabitans halophyticus]